MNYKFEPPYNIEPIDVGVFHMIDDNMVFATSSIANITIEKIEFKYTFHTFDNDKAINTIKEKLKSLSEQGFTYK